MSRIFIAVSPQPEIKRRLDEQNGRWKQLVRFAKWVHRDDLHLTIKFIGEIDDSDSMLALIQQRLESIALRFNAFQLQIGEPGTFGPPRSPMVLWQSVKGETGQLLQLQRQVEQAMDELDIPKENKKFRPHLTIARRFKRFHAV